MSKGFLARELGFFLTLEDDDVPEFVELQDRFNVANDPHRAITAEQIARKVKPALLKFLTPRQEYVIRARFGFNGPDKTLDQIAEALCVTPQRVRQIEMKALRLLSSLDAGLGLLVDPDERPGISRKHWAHYRLERASEKYWQKIAENLEKEGEEQGEQQAGDTFSTLSPPPPQTTLEIKVRLADVKKREIENWKWQISSLTDPKSYHYWEERNKKLIHTIRDQARIAANGPTERDSRSKIYSGKTRSEEDPPVQRSELQAAFLKIMGIPHTRILEAWTDEEVVELMVEGLNNKIQALKEEIAFLMKSP